MVRTKLKRSQSEFARMLGISVDTLQNREQDRRQPSGWGARFAPRRGEIPRGNGPVRGVGLTGKV